MFCFDRAVSGPDSNRPTLSADNGPELCFKSVNEWFLVQATFDG